MPDLCVIVEGNMDKEIIPALLQKRYPQLRINVRKPSGNKGGIARLAREIHQLIKSAQQVCPQNECIIVIHDADLKSRPHNRSDYDKIKSACETQKPPIKLLHAHDEVEAWLLADSGLCAWLNIKPVNCDEIVKPSDTLKSHLNKTKQLSYRIEDAIKITQQLRGDGNQRSPSLQKAFDHLDNEPCVTS